MDNISGSGIVGIVVASIVGFMSLIGAIIYLVQRRKYQGSNLNALSIITAGKALYYFIPYSLFLFGIVYDAINLKLKYLPAGFIGLLAVFLNYTFSSVFPEGLVYSDLCGIPGMGAMGSNISPQNILFSTTVLSYITFTNVAIDPSSINNIVPGISIAIIFLLQLLMYYLNGCSTLGWKTNALSSLLPPILALAGGLLIGGLFGWGFTLLINPKKETE